jgi:organic radical activating enzyme
MYKIKRLDFNVAYACNLSCKGCISLSDFDRRGVESLDDIKEQCSTWSKILTPSIITIFGGEPLMHPRIDKVLGTIREHWPNTLIRLITNGYLLRRFNPEIWFGFGKIEMQVSIHRQDHEELITKQIKRIVQCRKDWKVIKKKGEGDHRQLEFHNKDLSIHKSKFKEFVIPYRLENGELKPFKSNPKKAHSICGSPDVPILYKNKLYKCAPLPNILELDKGKHYKYEGIGVGDDVAGLIKNINKPESVCAMCPEKRSHSVNHFLKENVHVKNIS